MTTKQWNAMKRNLKKHAQIHHRIMERILASIDSGKKVANSY